MSQIFPETRKVTSVVNAAEKLNLEDWPEVWRDLEALSDRTVIDDTRIDPAGVIIDGDDRFRGILNVYVGNYDNNGEDFSDSDAFIGFFKGHFEPDGTPHIDQVTVDTSRFYEGAERAGVGQERAG